MLKMIDVHKHYEQFDLDCSLKVKSGCITGLIGRNGAGKSTTFKAILDLISIDEGKVELFGKDVKHLEAEVKQNIGVVLNDSGMSGYFSIHDVVKILKNMYIHFDEKDFITKCQQFHLPLNKKIKDFSTGMKAKLKVLIALSHQAKFLILDEPTAGLDVIARDELLDMLRDYMEQNPECAILMSSHISSDLESLCDDLYLIHEGKIIMHEDTDVLLSEFAILKIDEEKMNIIDREYLLKVKKENYGYACLTNQRQFYLENEPEIVIESCSIDDVMMLMMKGENV